MKLTFTPCLLSFLKKNFANRLDLVFVGCEEEETKRDSSVTEGELVASVMACSTPNSGVRGLSSSPDWCCCWLLPSRKLSRPRDLLNFIFRMQLATFSRPTPELGSNIASEGTSSTAALPIPFAAFLLGGVSTVPVQKI